MNALQGRNKGVQGSQNVNCMLGTALGASDNASKLYSAGLGRQRKLWTKTREPTEKPSHADMC